MNYNRENSALSSPELYHSIDLELCDFDELYRLCESCIYSTAHESVVASGFIDWTKIPAGRMHPLHRRLLESYKDQQHCMELLISNADDDFACYDANSKLYYRN